MTPDARALPMEVGPARTADAGALVAMRDAIAAWLTEEGFRQWNPGEFPRDRMRSWIRDGHVHVARDPARIVAAVAVLWDDEEVWGPDPHASAGYVHLLMVDRHCAGRGLGDVMLHHAEQLIAGRDRALVRLDAVATNPRLHDWYLRRGYRPVGTATFEDARWHDCLRFEKALPA